MTIRVNAFGKTIAFPAGTSPEDIENHIASNRAIIDPDYKEPEKGFLDKAGDFGKDFIQNSLGVDMGVDSKPAGVTGLLNSVSRGARQTGRMVGSTVDTVRGNLPGVEQYAEESGQSFEREAPSEQKQLLQELHNIDRDQSVSGQIGDTLSAAGRNKMGTAQLVAEQLPNTAVSLGGGYAGAKTGAVIGSLAGPVGAGAGGILGFLGGMFLGNVLLETGGKAIEKAEGGFTPEERDETLREGPIKAGVITGVDAATLGIGGKVTKALSGMAKRAGARAEAKVLMDAGVNMATPATINSALSASPALMRAAKVAGEKAALSSLSASRKAGIAGTGLALETVGEGVGEYLGELAATGDPDVVDATIESLAGMSQSMIETAYNYNKIGTQATEQDVAKAASDINAERTQQGIDNIATSGSVDEAIQAASDTVSQKPVTTSDVWDDVNARNELLQRAEQINQPTGVQNEAQTASTEAPAAQASILNQQITPESTETGLNQAVLGDDVISNPLQAQQEDNALEGNIIAQNLSNAPKGKKTEVILPDNTSLPAEWMVVDADSITASLKNGVNQPRDRTRAVSDIQVQNIAANPDYRRLSDSPVMDIGAPTISADGSIVGGNGRFEGISRAYSQGTANEFLRNLTNDAVNKGIDPATFAGMKKPVLVKRITQPFDTRKLAVASNSGGSLQYSALELARIDSERINGLSQIDIAETGDVALTNKNLSTIRNALGGYGNTELASFVDKDGGLSQEGLKRIKNAVLYSAYGDSATLSRMVESTDNDMRNIVGALTKVAGDVAKVRSNIKNGAIPKELDITDNLIEAVEKISQLRSTGMSVDQFMSQQAIFDDIDNTGESKQIMQMLSDTMRSQKKMAEFLRNVYDGISRINVTTDNVFGDTSLPTKSEIIENAKPKEQPGIFGADNETSQSDEQESATKTDNVKSSEESKFSRSPTERLKDRDRSIRLERLLRQSGHDFKITPADMRDFAAVGSRAEAGTAEKIAAIFGKRITPIKADGPFRINGVIIPSIKDTIFIDVRTDKMVHAVMGHELSHHMEQDAPKVYADMVDALRSIIVNDKGYRQKYEIPQNETEENVIKEIVGDIVGDNFTDQKFWDKVAAYNPNVFRRIADTVISWLKKLIGSAKLRKLGSEQWVTDAQKAQDIVANAVAQYTYTESSFDGLKNKPVFQKAWHGSPHDHNKFDSSKIGTGEGAAVYGWGLYFADKKEVAEFYREQFTPVPEIVNWQFGSVRLIKNGEYQDYSPRDSSNQQQAKAVLSEDMLIEELNIVEAFSKEGIDAAKKVMLEIADSRIDTAKEENPEIVSHLKVLRSRIENSLKFEAKQDKAHVYEVDLTPKPDEYLLWDKPLSEQSEKVKDILIRDGYTESDFSRNGEDIYVGISASQARKSKSGTGSVIKRNDKAASKYLHSLGIRGIKYLDGSSRGSGEGSYNYVIFNDNDVEITAKFSRKNIGKYSGDLDLDYSDAEQEDLVLTPSGQQSNTIFNHRPTVTQQGVLNFEEVESQPEPEQAKEKTLETTKNNNAIQDYGEKIGGARKDLAQILQKEFSDDEIASSTLSQIWPLKDINAIDDTYTAAFAYASRAEIPSKPRKSYGLGLWVKKVKMMRDFAAKIVSGDYTRKRIEDASSEWKTLEHFFNKVNLLEKIDRKHWSRISEVRVYKNAYRYDDDGIRIDSPYTSVRIDGRNARFNDVSSIDSIAKEVSNLLTDKAPEKKMKFEVRVSSRDGTVFINKQGDKERRRLKTFETTREAFDYIKNNNSDLVEAWESVKDRDNVGKSDVRKSENKPRTGADYRKGKDVTEKEFAETFGFRGVEFGNWVAQGSNSKERQGMINQAYDSFMDLANIIGVPPKALSLNGDLAMAFGSRGKGSASAHFEPDRLVINLTKTKGSGTLAHEWFHAMDNYFRRQRGDDKNTRETRYITYYPEPMLVHKEGKYRATSRQRLSAFRNSNPDNPDLMATKWEVDPKHKLGVRPEVEAKFADLVNALDKSPMKKRAAAIDQGKQNGYWSRIIERAARSFENYIIAKMAREGYHNDYLANVVKVKDFVRNEYRYPYLLESELAPVEAAFDNLFSTIETKETDKGVAMFSRTESKLNRAESVSRKYGYPETAKEPLYEFNSAERLKLHKEYKKAKSGNIESAVKLARDLVSERNLAEAKKRFGSDVVYLPVVLKESDGTNRIPHAIAAVYANNSNAEIETGVFEKQKAFHTGMNMMERLISRASFSGEIVKGKRYVIVDDVTTSGATLSDLASYIQENGGEVAGSVLLTNAIRGGSIFPLSKTINRLEAQHGDSIREIFGIEPSALTKAESQYLLGFRTDDEIRKRADKAGNSRRERILAKSIPKSEDSLKFSRSGTLSQAGVNTEVADNTSDLPEETKFQAFRRRSQDAMLRFKVMQNWLDKQGVKLSEAANVYQRENISKGKQANKIEDFRRDQLEPLINRIAETSKNADKEGKFTLGDVATYLEAVHIPEANERMRTIHKDENATANGITDEQAKNVIKQFEAMPNFREFKKLAEELRRIGTETLDMRLEAGLISQDQYEAYKATYDNWVPLRGNMSEQGFGKGLSTNAKDKRRMGHGFREDEFVLENLVQDRERAIMQIEKNKVGLSVAQFLMEAQNENIGTVDKPEKMRVMKDFSYAVKFKGDVVGSFETESAAKAMVQRIVDKKEKILDGKSFTSTDFAVEKTYDPHITMMARPQLSDNEIQVYVNGHAVKLQLNDPGLARAATNAGIEQVGSIAHAARMFNRFLSKAYTAWSPDFLFMNMARDAYSGTLVLTGKKGAKFAAKTFTNYGTAIRELIKGRNDPKRSEWVSRYRAAGGNIGAAYLSDIERVGEDAMAALQEFAGARETYRMVYNEQISKGAKPAKARTMAVLKAGVAKTKTAPVVGKMFQTLERVNMIIENALRLATFKTAIESGESDQQAATLSKDLMNFNRKGEVANQMGALYLFYNPGMQGAHIVGEALFTSPHRKQVWSLLGVLTTLSFVLAELARGGDDDEREWENTPDYIKDRNLIFNFGDKQVTVPVAYGFGIFHAMGNYLSDLNHGADKSEIAVKLASGAFENFSVFGNPILENDEGNEIRLDQLLPTFPKIIMAPGINLDGLGRQIHPTKYQDSVPDSQLMWRSVRGTAYEDIAQFMNGITGGSEYNPGAIDVSPNTIKYWVTSLTGGAGRFVSDITTGSLNAAEGVDPEIDNIPVLRKFIREPGVNDTRGAFHKARKEAQSAAERAGKALRNGDIPEYTKMMSELQPIIEIAKYARDAQKMASMARDEVMRIQLDTDMSKAEKKLRIKEIELQEQRVYDQFLSAFDVAKRSLK